MRAQTDEEVLAGLLPVAVGGREVILPILRRAEAREWRASLRTTFERLATIPSDTLESQEAMSDAQLELILAYDRTGVLGDRETLDRTMTEVEQAALYDKLTEISFPFVTSQVSMVLAIIRQAIESAKANSTNGPSSTGDLIPLPSTPASPTSRSSGSGRRRRSA